MTLVLEKSELEKKLSCEIDQQKEDLETLQWQLTNTIAEKSEQITMLTGKLVSNTVMMMMNIKRIKSDFVDSTRYICSVCRSCKDSALSHSIIEYRFLQMKNCLKECHVLYLYII